MIAQRLRRSALEIRQHYRYDCGAAALASVAAFYGIRASLAQIRMACGCTPEGISIQGIIDGAARIGLTAKGYRSAEKDLSPLKGLGGPAIAHIRDNDGYLHFVVLYEVGGEKLQVMDPATGKMSKVPAESFRECWSGYIIVAVPDAAAGCGGGKETPVHYHLLAILKSFFREIALSFAGSATCTFAGIGITFLLQQLIDEVVPTGNLPAMVALGTLAVALTALSLYIGWATAGYLIRCSIKMETSLAARYLYKIFSLPQEFFNNYRAGDISSRTDDIRNIRSFITEGIIGMLTSAVTIVGALLAMLLYNPRLTLYMSLFVPLYYVLYRLSGRISGKYSREIASANASYESDIIDGISGIGEIRHYGAQSLALGRIEGSLVTLMGKLHSSANALNIFETLVQGVSRSMTCIILTVGSAFVLREEMTIGELVGFYSLCTFLTVPLGSLISTGETIARTTVSCSRIFEILNLPDESCSSDGISPQGLSGELQLHSVAFRFPGREKLLEDVSFTVPKGKITLLRGESGCGKSTLARLIMRDYAPSGGKICLGGIDIAQFNLQQWRAAIGFVPQAAHLFNGTILENITLGAREPDMEKVLGICLSLGMEGMIRRFPQGLLTHVGENGMGLSGGECQKVSIARAVYRNPGIYIFDEVTSSLDSWSEQCVLKVMQQLRDAGKTIVFISHKEVSLTVADNVVTINEHAQSGNLRSTYR